MSKLPLFEMETVTGSRYVFDGSSVVITSSGYTERIRAGAMKSVDRKNPNFVKDDRVNWDYLHELPNSLPEVGKSYYVSSFNEWRISSEIKSVTITGLNE